MASDIAYHKTPDLPVQGDSTDDSGSSSDFDDAPIEVETSPAPAIPKPAKAKTPAADAQSASSSNQSSSTRARAGTVNLDVPVSGATEDELFLEGTLMTPFVRGATSINPLRTFCRLSDMTFYAYSKSTSSNPRKFIDCETLTDIQSSSGPLEFKLIDRNNREYKMRALTSDDYDNWTKTFQGTISRRQRAANKTIKVWFMDISKLSIVIERGRTTAEDLWWLVCEALNLSHESRDSFFIWVMGADLQVLLCNDDIVTNVLEDWHPNYEERYSSKLEGPPRLVFRTTQLLSLSHERNLKDPKAVHLFYLQAAYNILYSNYVVDEATAISLAGLAAQIRMGDFDPKKHQPGYIGRSIKRYVPYYLADAHKRTLGRWELMIQQEHASHKGKSLLICEMLYLQRCRTIPYYGCIFFNSKNRDKARESGYWSMQSEGKINIGINMDGIHICKDLKYLHSYAWKNIQHWEIEQDKYFYFVAHATKPGKGTTKKAHTYLLETKAAPLIKDHLQDIVTELKRQERQITKIKETQTKSAAP